MDSESHESSQEQSSRSRSDGTDTWTNALTLSERAASFRNENRRQQLGASRDRNVWRWASQFTSGEFDLSGMLSLFGVSSDEFEQILSSPSNTWHNPNEGEPAWFADLKAAFQLSTGDWMDSAESPSSPDVEMFVGAAQPIIQQSVRRLWKSVSAWCEPPSALSVNRSQFERLYRCVLHPRLNRLLGRTLTLEMHVARARGLLAGDNDRDRYRSFGVLLRNPTYYRQLLADYPVLFRSIVETINRCESFFTSFLQRLADDWNLLSPRFSLDEGPVEITDIKSTVGDVHNGGTCVLIVELRGGKRLVYRPRDCELYEHLRDLMHWMRSKGQQPDLRVPYVLAMRGYGWIEYVPHRECRTERQIVAFYERLGSWLAILYALEGTDFHLENLIADGEHPVLIDLETLFHPRIGPEASTRGAGPTGDSVLRTGLLPNHPWATGTHRGIDLSGVGGASGQQTPFEVPVLEGIGRDHMHVVRQKVETGGAENQPTYRGKTVDPSSYVPSVKRGFTRTYRLLQRHGQELIEQGGVLSIFASDWVRVIMRPTKSYASMLSESYHPSLMQDALERDRLFALLWLRVQQAPYMQAVAAAELADLHRGDIPLFMAKADGHTLWGGSGDQIENLINLSGLEEARTRVRDFSEESMQRQLWIIDASMTAAYGPKRSPRETSDWRVPRDARVPVERLLQASLDVGDRLATLAHRQDDEASWLSLHRRDVDDWRVAPAGTDLYAGAPGIVLFLAYLGEVAGEERYTELARMGWQSVTASLADELPKAAGIGAFEGAGGLLFVLAHLARLWGDSTLHSLAEWVVGEISHQINDDNTFDIVTGTAGSLITLLAWHAASGSRNALDAAVRCGERIVESARPMDAGCGWPAVETDRRALGGFSHGVAGIVWALTRLGALTTNDRLLPVIREGLIYERSLYSEHQRNWRDLRLSASQSSDNADGTPEFSIAWCHGAPGVGMSRLLMWPYLQDAEIVEEISAAMTTTIAKGFGHNHSMCHGDVGNLEILRSAANACNNDYWADVAEGYEAALLADIERGGWRCGIDVDCEIPGMMTGIAGIGMGLLRLATPDRVPSVLALEPPK